MSKLAILRRQCKRAMRQLIHRFNYPEDAFEIADKGNSHDVLPGTPIYWTPPSYYEGESDSSTARDHYAHALMCSDEKYWSRAARQMEVQWRDKQMRNGVPR